MKLHFIGIGGTGMGALAIILRAAGHEVRGSDTKLYPPMSTQLARAEIPVAEGFAAENLSWNPDLVVVGNVCRSDHPEVAAAKAANVELDSFPGTLRRMLLADRRSVVVAGTHGKTTTSSLVAWLLQVGGAEPSWLIGGVPQNLSRGANLGTGDVIVLEGDEYDTAFFDKKSKFLHYEPRRAVITSIEYDHADIFEGLDEVREAFAEFVALIPRDGELIVHADDSEAMGVASTAKCKIVTYRALAGRQGEDEGAIHSADYVARVTSRVGARRTTFELYERGELRCELSTLLIGRYNIGNILAAVAVARGEGCDFDLIERAVARFRGVKRRQELLGVAQGVRIVEDFAHHPTAVQLTVTAIRKRFPEKGLHVCFEPRSSSSRRSIFFDGYVRAFDAATRVYVAPVYAPERVPDGMVLDTKALASAVAQRGVTAHAYESIDTLAQSVLAEAVPGDTVLLLSSGAFGGLDRQLLDGFGDAVTFAGPEDLAPVNALLESYGLPALQDPHEVESLIIRPRSGEPPIGCVHMQIFGNQAFLFGLAVAQERRGEGLGWVLADSVLRRSRTLGASAVTLLAGDSADFFASKLGFSTLAIDAVDAEVRQSANFLATLARHAQASAMRFELPPEA